MVQIAGGKHRQARGMHLFKKFRTAGDFPSVKLGTELIAVIPKMKSLWLANTRVHRMCGNSDGSLIAQAFGHRHDLSFGRNPLADPETKNMRRAMVRP